MRLRVSTWNINSVRLRMPLVRRFLAEAKPDVLCLQETKVRDAEFPLADLREAGYEHIAINGQKGYHGVAIASRLPFEAVDKREFCRKGDARHVAVTLGGKPGDRQKGLTVHSVYVPAGGDEPDPVVNPKFRHKLDFVDEMGGWFRDHGVAEGRSLLLGDLNIAPLEHDVWSHKALLKVVSHTPVEVEKFEAARAQGRWIDAMRVAVPHPAKLYSWWSYRSPDWAAADKGRRLDHVWLSPDLDGALAGVGVLKEARGWERPSDHVPVTVEIDL